MFLFLIFAVFIFVVFVSLFEDNETNYAKWLYCGSLVVLTLMVALRPIGIDNDSTTYVSYYEAVDGGVVDLIEPSFHLISSFARVFESPRLIFIVYALLAIPLKGYALTKFSGFWFMSLAIWLNNYFILQECTQIRTAVASSIFLYALFYLEKRKLLVYTLLVCVAMFFHYSAVILLPLVFLRAQRLSCLWRIVLAVAPLLCYAIHMVGIDPVTFIPIPLFQEKMQLYEAFRDLGIEESINIFNVLALFRLCCYYFILWKCDVIFPEFKYVYLILKVMCLSICCFALFAFIPALGMRSQELLGVLDILLLPAMIYAVKPEWVVRVILGLACLGIFSMNIFINKYLSFGAI